MKLDNAGRCRMQQVADWLEKLGLGQYAQRFAENDINFGILPHLTDQDLKDLGITSVGHRRQLLLAMAELRGVRKGAQPPSAGTEPATAQHDAAERRQVTVMFSDLVGSTALSARMDPEDLREVIAAYQKAVAETVQRLGGFVAKYMGDGVLVYFGFPQAHEDDPERAVRAGLELIQAVEGLKSSPPLQTRVGIATGLVVVGDLIGSGEAQERGIVGETPNLAARLQGIAEPNTVVVAESTRKLLGNFFDLRELGGQDLKGISGPVRAWAVLRPASVESRFEALHASGLTELVGREEELELLLRRWSKAKTGEGQVVLLSGEAGIGKSRLTAALLESIAGEPHTRLRYFCSPQHTDSAFYPIIGQMERAAGFAHDDWPEAKLDKLDRVLAQTSTSKEDAALFADMLSLPGGGRYPVLQLEPQQRRQRTLHALLSQMEALSLQDPVLMIFEDAHWSDPTSLEAFGRVIDRIATLRVLLLVTFRPEFAPPWIGLPHITALTLNRLPNRAVGAMIDGVVGNKPLPASIRQDIIERTDGVPLFVEEMTKAVLESESEDKARRTVAAVPSPALAVPASLQASLMARLDRLGSAKEIAQIGAAIGREFSHPLLAAVAIKPEAELASALDRLMQSGLLSRQGLPPHATYLFKHALVQDAAYGTLLRQPRRALHSRIAEALESQFPDIAESQPELLARHCTEAGLSEKAVSHWLKAGQQAVARSAMAEAVAQLQKGLGLLATMPISPESHQQELALRLALAPALMATHGMAAPVVREAYARARVLAEKLGRSDYLVPVAYGQWLIHLARSEGAQALSNAERMEQIGHAHDDNAITLLGYYMHGQTCLYRGDLVEARALFERGRSLDNPAHRGVHAKLVTADPLILTIAFLAVTLTLLGYLDQGRSLGKNALHMARQLKHAHTLTTVLAAAVITIEGETGSFENASTHADEVIRLSTEHGFPMWLAFGNASRAFWSAMLGQIQEGLAVLTQTESAAREAGSVLGRPTILTRIAALHLKLGQHAQGLNYTTQAMQIVNATNNRSSEPSIHRVRGDLLLAIGDQAAAEESYHLAYAVAGGQAAKLEELRAAMSMARLWRDQGKRHEAHELLAPVYGWFTEGFNTLDLREAKTLLHELAT
jgi:class 3 adenylate cyclase/tetratricopeptide (TPR) repeat protein